MHKKSLTLFIVVFTGMTSGGCTYRAWFEGFKDSQRIECYRHVSQYEQEKCLEELNSMTYDEYRKKREELKK